MSRRNWTQDDRGAEWHFGTDGPKQAAIDAGDAMAHEVFLEQVTEKGRRFASYASVSDMTQAFGITNAHLFEILVPGRPVKLYLDIEYVGQADELATILDTLSEQCSHILNFTLDPATLRISCGSGDGEEGSYAGKVKQSFHVVVDNGFAFRSTSEVRAFVCLAFAGDDRVDKAPYGRNQSFKLIHQSKLNSTRVQKPMDGHSFLQHMVSAFADEPDYYCSDKLKNAVHRTTALQVIPPEPACLPDRPPFVPDDVDIHSVPCLLSYFPNGPTKSLKQPFAVYLAVACVCVNESEPYDTFATWASRYQSWSPVKSERIWKSLSKRLDGYDIRTLRTMLSKACPSVLQDIQTKVIAEVMVPTIDLAAHGFDTFQYCEPRMEPWLHQARTYKNLIVRGPMGSGKTHQIVNTIRDLRPKSVLVITPRQLFARSMYGTLLSVLPDLKIYKDLAHDDRRHPYIVCQLESLWTLGRSQYDLVLMDECESNLYQFSSPTIQHFKPICDRFKKIILSAKKVIYTDAFVTDRTLLTCVNIDPASTRCFIHNTWVPQGRRAFFAGRFKDGKASIVNAAHQLRGECNVFVSASKEIAKQVHAVLEPTGTCHLITSETSDETKKRLEDVDSFLRDARAFIYTSSITVGTSYDRRDHFDNLLM